MLPMRTFSLAGAVAAAGQQQLLPCWLASLQCITETIQAAVPEPLRQYMQQLQHDEAAARPPGVLPLGLQHASSENTQQQQMLLQLQASSATQHEQWPALHWPAHSSVAAAQWCGSQMHQARFWNNGSSSSSSYHATMQQVRGMHRAPAGVQKQQLQAKPSAAGSTSASSGKDGAGASHQRQQQQQQATTFEGMGLPDTLLQALNAQGFAVPTPVQVAAQGAVLSGRNVALQSATGTGKTLAYLLPLMSQLQPWRCDKQPKHTHGRVLVLCPTQELCMQVLRAARSIMPHNRNRVQPLVGGANPLRQLMALKEHKPCIVVATPGRLLKVIHKGGAFFDAFPLAAHSRGSSREHRMVLVLEEADKLLAMSDTVQVLRMLAAWLHDDKRELEQHREALKSMKGLRRKDRFERVKDVDNRDPSDEEDSRNASFMPTVLRAYQVLLVSAGLKPSTLAGAPAWAATNPVMIAAPPPAAPVVLPGPSSSTLSSSGMRQNKSSDGSRANAPEVGTGSDEGCSGSSSSEDAALDSSCSIEQERQRLLEMGLLREGKGLLAKKGAKGELGQRAERALMIPEHIKHQFLLYPRGGAMEKYLLRCLNSYLGHGCKALVFVGQRQNVWALQMELQRSRQLKAELGALHAGVKPQEKASLLRRFNSGQLRALLLTDAYGLGLDFKDVDVVFAVESLPAGLQQYIRRSGRTGRMGRPGTVLSIIPDQRRDALKRMLKRLFIDPQEMVLKQDDISSGGSWVIKPKLTAEGILAGSKARREPPQQQQQQQRPQRQRSEQGSSWDSKPAAQQKHGRNSGRLKKPVIPSWRPHRPF